MEKSRKVTRRVLVATVMLGVITGIGACGGGSGDEQLAPGDRTFCDAASSIVPTPRQTSGVDLDDKLGAVSNKDLQRLGSGVRDKSRNEVGIVAGKIVARCSDLGYHPPAPSN